MSSPSNKTPESYFTGLRRKDSKNALTTCHGVTDKGKACRRPIGGSATTNRSTTGAFVISKTDRDPAVFFCWQHKHQANSFSEVVEVIERTSLEEAFRNLGLEEVEEVEEEAPIEQYTPPSPRPKSKYDAAPRLSTPDGRVEASERPERSSDHRHPPRQRPSYDENRHRRRDHRYSSHYRSAVSDRDSNAGFWSSLLGGCLHDGQAYEQRHRPHRDKLGRDNRQYQSRTGPRASTQSTPPRTQPTPVSASTPVPGSHAAAYPAAIREQRNAYDYNAASGTTPLSSRHTKQKEREKRQHSGFEGSPSRTSRESRPKVFRDPVSAPAKPSGLLAAAPNPNQAPAVLADKRPENRRSKSSPGSIGNNQNGGEWLPVMPPTENAASRAVVFKQYAKLLSTMSEKPSGKDAPGFIYIFWQTDVEQTEAETSAAASLINTPRNRPQRNDEEVLRRRFFQTSANATLPPREKRTIFLKIGRAGNVHQRLAQWEKQCQYNISLLRSYPHSARGGSERLVPYVGRVEHLIHLHLEMLGKRVKRQCRCKTEHREWFEVDATPKAIREVDEIVQCWIGWAEENLRG